MAKKATGEAAGKGYELIITEKPSTAEKIASALADGKPVKKAVEKVAYYELSHGKKDVVVASAVGHLYTVAEKEKSFSYPSYDVEWRLTADVEKDSGFSRKYATLIKRLAKGASQFTVATDYDIEGETIGLNIVRYLCGQKDAARMKFSTVTAEDLREAYGEKSRTLDWGQANAGTTRHVLDWLYGINVSRALTSSVKAAGSFMVLSTGRVQGPALRIVVEREREIQAFVPEDYWQLELSGTKDGKPWAALHEKDRFTVEKDAQAILKKCTGKPAIVEGLDSRQAKQQAPSPFDLGTLQSEAYRAFGIKPKDTLDVAQSLYSAAYISYPRTSSQKLPAKIGYRKILASLARMDTYKEPASLLLGKSLLTPNEGKKEDAAHPAIYPTGEVPGELGPRERKVYDLIVRRFFATFGDEAVRETSTVSLVVGGERFTLSGTRTVHPGWHALYGPYVDLKEEELPAFKPREQVPYDALEMLKKQTKPPRRYTPSSLVTELEKRGLGTKATRAEIAESLARRNYVKGERNIEVTELGMKIFEVLEKSAPEITDAELTRHFEEEMEQIREGEKTGDDVIDEAKTELDKILKKFRKSEASTGKDLIEARRLEQDLQNTLFACPVCKEGTLKIMFSKKNKRRFIGCSRYPDCSTAIAMPQMGMVKASEKQCESCAWPMLMVIRKGRPPALTCINPECPQKVALEQAQQALAKKAGEGKPCPKCGEGKLTLKRGRFGMFLGCDQYPKCATIVNIPRSEEDAREQEEQKRLAKGSGEGKVCPKCGEGKLTLKRSARGFFLGCDQYPKCRTVVKIGAEAQGAGEEKPAEKPARARKAAKE